MPAAAKSGQTALLAALARHGASPEGAVLEAAQAGHVANLRFLLAEASPRGNVAERREESDGGATPLHVAAFAGHAGAVQALLDFGADALAEDAEGLLASHYAASTRGLVCLRGQTQVLQALAAKGGYYHYYYLSCFFYYHYYYDYCYYYYYCVYCFCMFIITIIVQRRRGGLGAAGRGPANAAPPGRGGRRRQPLEVAERQGF